MPTFPTAPSPVSASSLILPSALKDVSHSGIISVRATKQVGWSFQFSYGILDTASADDMAIMSFINQVWSRGTAFDITHPTLPGSGLSPNGAGPTTSITVNGASQTGGTVNITGFGGAVTNAVRAGDLIKFAGDDGVYQIWADSNAASSTGHLAASITPNLRKSPANSAAVTLTGIQFKVILSSRSRMIGSSSPHAYAGMSATFLEYLNT